MRSRTYTTPRKKNHGTSGKQMPNSNVDDALVAVVAGAVVAIVEGGLSAEISTKNRMIATAMPKNSHHALRRLRRWCCRFSSRRSANVKSTWRMIGVGVMSSPDVAHRRRDGEPARHGD